MRGIGFLILADGVLLVVRAFFFLTGTPVVEWRRVEPIMKCTRQRAGTKRKNQ